MTDNHPTDPDREFISIGAGYSLATVGQGSTMRLWQPDGSYMIVSPDMYHADYEKMARAIGAEITALQARRTVLEANRLHDQAEIARLREAVMGTERDDEGDSWASGWNACLSQIRKRAALEGEG